jgi:hypothetical protein
MISILGFVSQLEFLQLCQSERASFLGPIIEFYQLQLKALPPEIKKMVVVPLIGIRSEIIVVICTWIPEFIL